MLLNGSKMRFNSWRVVDDAERDSSARLPIKDYLRIKRAAQLLIDGYGGRNA